MTDNIIYLAHDIRFLPTREITMSLEDVVEVARYEPLDDCDDDYQMSDEENEEWEAARQIFAEYDVFVRGYGRDGCRTVEAGNLDSDGILYETCISKESSMMVDEETTAKVKAMPKGALEVGWEPQFTLDNRFYQRDGRRLIRKSPYEKTRLQKRQSKKRGK